MENAIYKLRKAIEINPDAHLAIGIIYRAKLKKRESEGGKRGGYKSTSFHRLIG